MSTRFSRAHLLNQVLATQDQEVILYLYEGAIGHLDRAIEALQRKDRRAAAEWVQRASSVVIELSCCLDYNREGALALRLDSIYNYLIEALSIASRTLDLEALQTCRSVLSIMDDAWGQALDSERRADEVASAGVMRLGA